jgi:hypothetical protein
MGRRARRARRWAKALIPAPRLSFPERFRRSEASPYAFPIERENPLEALGRKYGPTKRNHGYLPFYWMHLRDIRTRVRGVCEIGLQGDRSLRMWEEFFPNATIYGIDVDPANRRFEGDRRRVFIGDQGDAAFLGRFLREVDGGLDVVIDDGSHRMRHQLQSFNALFPALTSHGVYVIEDTGGLAGCEKTVERMKKLVDSIMYWPASLDAADWPTLGSLPDGASWADRNTIGVAFYRWIVFVLRGRNPEDNPHLRRTADGA